MCILRGKCTCCADYFLCLFEEFGVVLAEMTASKETPVQYRQVLLSC